MTLNHLSDDTLLSATLVLVRNERELLTDILHHLREIERRRLYSGYSSLFAYAVGALGYSEDQAYRRIAAMRLLKEMPEIESKIEAGEINLTHVGLAHALFKNEKKHGRPLSAARKTAVFVAMAGRSAREAQKSIQSFATAPAAFRETTRPLDLNRSVATIELKDATLAKIERLKGWLAHERPDLSIGELVDRLCDLGLDHWDPARPIRRKRSFTNMKTGVNVPSRAAIRREVWRRDGGACTRCGGDYAIEEDHIVPRALGGAYSVENIRLLCRSCNQRAAVEVFGVLKMDRYLSPAAPRIRPASVLKHEHSIHVGHGRLPAAAIIRD